MSDIENLNLEEVEQNLILKALDQVNNNKIKKLQNYSIFHGNLLTGE